MQAKLERDVCRHEGHHVEYRVDTLEFAQMMHASLQVESKWSTRNACAFIIL